MKQIRVEVLPADAPEEGARKALRAAEEAGYTRLRAPRRVVDACMDVPSPSCAPLPIQSLLVKRVLLKASSEVGARQKNRSGVNPLATGGKRGYGAVD